VAVSVVVVDGGEESGESVVVALDVASWLPLPVVVEKCARRSGPNGPKHDLEEGNPVVPRNARNGDRGRDPEAVCEGVHSALADRRRSGVTGKGAGDCWWKAVKDGVVCFVEATRGAVGF
jgi:hypothetical protein